MVQTSSPAMAAHGAAQLPTVDLDSYNIELKDDDGFIGDRASKGAFWDVISNLRAELAKLDADPLEDEGEDI